MADRHVIYKNGAKEIASQLGLSITFMAKYSTEEVGSSCHVHSSLWDPTGEKPLMWEADAPEHQSPAFRGLARRAARVRTGDGVDVRAHRQLLQALPARVVGADCASPGASTTARAASAWSATGRRSGSSRASRAAT